MLFDRGAMFNRRASQPKFRAEEIVETLEPQKGSVVADIGSGGGYFTVLFAKAVGPQGTVYAVDTDAKLLAHVREYACEQGVANVQTVEAQSLASRLPQAGCDQVFARNVYHHLDDPEDYFRTIQDYLKPRGRLAVIDYQKQSGFSFVALFGHYVKETEIRAAVERAGFTLAQTYDFLPEQSFNVFRVKAEEQ
jgi:predicted methyltransferase